MGITISIDAAMHSTGIAIFSEEKLIQTDIVTIVKDVTGRSCAIAMILRVVIYLDEFSRVHGHPEIKLVIEGQEYRKGRERMNINTFADLYSVGIGIAAASHFLTTFYTPREWKGTVKKEVMTKRILNKEIKDYLTPDYLLRDGQDDIIDAIGLGRFYLNGK